MYRYRLIALVALFAVVLSVGGARSSSAQDKAQGRGQIVRSYRNDQGQAPEWAAKAIDKSVAHQSSKAGNSKAEFKKLAIVVPEKTKGIFEKLFIS